MSVMWNYSADLHPGRYPSPDLSQIGMYAYVRLCASASAARRLAAGIWTDLFFWTDARSFILLFYLDILLCCTSIHSRKLPRNLPTRSLLLRP